MPYIENWIRKSIDNGSSPVLPGELNYKIYKTILDYWNRGPRSYQTINDIIGAIEGAKNEFQRQIVGPYEDTKIQANGDIY